MNKLLHKRIAPLLLVILIVCSSLTISAFAATGDKFKFQIIFTSDLHGSFSDYRYSAGQAGAGLARIATKIKERKALNPNSLLIDVGDTIQGNGTAMFHGTDWDNNPANTAKMYPTMYGLQTLGYDAWILGNHEFNFGMTRLDKAYGKDRDGVGNHGFKGAILAGNVYADEGNIYGLPKDTPLYDSFFVKKFDNGPNVAIIGMTHDGIVNWDYANVVGDAKLYTRKPAIVTKETIDYLKSSAAEQLYGKIDVFVAAEHLASGDSEAWPVIDQNVNDLDVFIGAHGHSATNTLRNGVRFVELAGNAGSLGAVEITATQQANGSWKVLDKSGSDVSYTAISPGSVSDASYRNLPFIENAHQIALAYSNQPVGTLTGGPLVAPSGGVVRGITNNHFTFDSALTHLFHDAFIYYANAYVDKTPALAALGKRVTLSASSPLNGSANQQPGALTRASIGNLYTYDNNTLCIIELTGWQLKLLLEWGNRSQGQGTSTPSSTNFFPTGTIGTSYDQMMYSGLQYKADLSKPAWSRITEMKNMDGTPFDMDKVYWLAANNHTTGSRFLMTGNANYPGDRLAALPNSQKVPNPAGGVYDMPQVLTWNAEEILTVNGQSIYNAEGCTGVVADYVMRVKAGNLTNEFKPNWRFASPCNSDETLYKKAIEVVNANIGVNYNTATLEAVRGKLATTVTPLWDRYIEALALVQADYAPAKWSVFAYALKNAGELILASGTSSSSTTTQTQADNALAALNAAITGLTAVPTEPTTEINILSFNDFHGAIEQSGNSNPGAARFTAIVKKLKETYPNTYVVAGGDNYQGSAVSNYYLGKPVSEMLKALGVEYSSLGNHEFDWGADKIKGFADDGNIDFVCANMFLKGTDNRPDFVKPFVVKEIANKKIGFVGFVTTAVPTLVKAEYVADYDFRAPGSWLSDIVNHLKNDLGCDAVLALSHDGSTSALSGYGIAGVVNGHTHSTQSTTNNGTAYVQAGYNGRNVGRLRLVFDNINNKLTVTPSYDNKVQMNNDAIVPVDTVDTDMSKIINWYINDSKSMFDEVVGQADIDLLTQSTVNQWATQLVYDYIKRLSGTPYVVIQNSGGWRSMSGQFLEKGKDIDYRWLNVLMPFDNEIVLMDLPGNMLINALNGKRANGSSNVTTSPVIAGAYKSGSNWYLSDGTLILASGTYKVSCNDFMYTGGDNYNMFEPYATGGHFMGDKLRDAMADQIRFKSIPQPNEGDTKEITIFQTSDIHGAFAGKNFATQGNHAGLSRVALLLNARRDALKTAGKKYLTIDVGDTIQGAGTSGFIGNNDYTFPVIKGLNYLKYDVEIPGNHEFNFGIPALLSSFNGAVGTNNTGFSGAKLCGNVFQYKGDTEPSYVGDDDAIAAIPEANRDSLLPGFKAYKIFNVEGVKVAVIGMSHPGADMWDAVKLQEYNTYTESAIGATRRALAAIQAEGGADVIILAAHMSESDSFNRAGSGASSVLRNTDISSKIDLFLGAHGHSNTNKLISGVRYVENSSNGGTFKDIKITVTYEGGKWVVKNKDGAGVVATSISVSSSATQDANYLAYMQPEIDFAENYAKIKIGELINGDMVTSNLKGTSSLNAAYFEPTKLVSFIHEVQKYYAEAEISGACPFSTGVQHKQGDITRGSLIGIYNYDSNTVYRLSMKGAHIKKWMEYVASSQYTNPTQSTDLSVRFATSYRTDSFSGLNYTVDLTKAAGSRITITTVKRLDGTIEPFDPEKRYIVAANDYRTSSGIFGTSILTAAELAGPDAPVILETDCNRGLPIAPDIISLMVDYIQNVKGGVIDALDFEKNWKMVPWWETSMTNGAYLREQGERLTQEGKITNVSSSSALTATAVKNALDAEGQKVLCTATFDNVINTRVENRTRQAKTGMVVAAIYDKATGKLVALESTPFDITDYNASSQVFTKDLTDYPTDQFSYRVFCMDDNYVPLTTAVEKA